MSQNTIFSLVSALVAVLCLTGTARADCRVESQTYSANDGLVIAKAAHIVTFTADCSDPKTGLNTLYADLNGQTVAATRSVDGAKKQVHQISWVVELTKASSASLSIPVYDEEGLAALRTAQKAGQSPPKPLLTLEVSHSSPYKGPLLQSELVATIAALGLWWLAHNAKTKLTN